MNKRNILFPIVVGLVALGFLTHCHPASQPSGQAGPDKITVPPLTLTPTHLPATATAPPVSATTVSPTLSVAITTPPPPPPTTADPVLTAGPLPSLLAQIPLAPPGESLVDILLDQASARLYVTDTSGQLHVLDANTYSKITTLPAAGSLTLDAANHRLYTSSSYAWSEDGLTEVTIIDTDSLAVSGSVSPHGSVAVDSSRNRFYVTSAREGILSIRLFDGVTLEQLNQVSLEYGPSPFGPSVVYNPLRDELLVENYTVYSVNPETLEITGNLFPDMLKGGCPTCYGQDFASAICLFPERNILLVEINTLVAGHGGGLVDQPHFFDTTTLTPLTNPAQLPAIEHSCSKAILAEPIDDHIYRGKYYVTYEGAANLLVYDLEGNLVSWLDGLYLGLTNPNTKQMYLSDYDDGTLVLDMTTLSPLGRLPPLSCPFLDKERGRIYAFQKENLVIFTQWGGRNKPAPITPVEALPNSPITLIQPSPHYPEDQTLFLVADRLYRSQDGGQTWAQLDNSLFELYGSYADRGLAFSPDFVHDHTLFTYYGRDESPFGAGVFRSTNGGDTWQPMWHGLTHLRVYDLVLSPNYANDGALLAYAYYHNLNNLSPPSPHDTGHSLFSSNDRGQHWTLVMTASTASAATRLPIIEPATRFRLGYQENRPVIERSDNRGQTWKTLPLALDGVSGGQVFPSPHFVADQTVYVLHDQGLLRSTDGGETWQNWADEWLLGRDSTNRLTTMAISPARNNDQPQLFVGTAAGEFRVVTPTSMTWELLASVGVVELTPPLLIDSAGGRLYAAGQLDGKPHTFVLARDGQVLASYDFAGKLALDSVHHWLYIDQGEAGLAVINTQTGTLQALIPLPPDQDPYPPYPPAPQADPSTNQVFAFRNNVVYGVDPVMGRVTDTLVTDPVEVRFCDSTQTEAQPIEEALYDSTRHILYTQFLAYTCSNNPDFHRIVSYDMTSNTKIAQGYGSLWGAAVFEGYLYYQDYSFQRNLALVASIRAWREGQPWLEVSDWSDFGTRFLVDPTRQRLYQTTNNGNLRVFDTQNMALVMQLPQPLAGELVGYDPQTDQLYFLANGRLQIRPGQIIQPPTPELVVSQPPTTSVRSLVVSPYWPENPTLVGIWEDPTFAGSVTSYRDVNCRPGGLLYLSHDGGQRWSRSLAGFRGDCEHLTTLVMSPDYARHPTLIAGVTGLGIFKSTDGGQLWQPANAGLTRMLVEQIILSPGFAADQLAFANAGYHNWYRSRDGGQNWQVLAEPKGVWSILALSSEFDEDRILMKASYNTTFDQTQLYISKDEGDHWDLVGNMPKGVQVSLLKVAPLFNKWQTLFAAGSDGNNHILYHSQDGGLHWTAVLTQLISTEELVYAPGLEENRPLFLLATIKGETKSPGAPQKTIYHSRDGGLTWELLALPAGTVPTALAISPNFAQDRLLFVGTMDGQVLRLAVMD